MVDNKLKKIEEDDTDDDGPQPNARGQRENKMDFENWYMVVFCILAIAWAAWVVTDCWKTGLGVLIGVTIWVLRKEFPEHD